MKEPRILGDIMKEFLLESNDEYAVAFRRLYIRQLRSAKIAEFIGVGVFVRANRTNLHFRLSLSC